MIFETSYWHLKHRPDSKLPGYLILAAKNTEHHSLASLPKLALMELGLIQAHASKILEEQFDVKLVYQCKWGHQSGFGAHFHIVPLYDWVTEAYCRDSSWPERNPDGPIYFTYITRAFIEYDECPKIIGPSVDEVTQVFIKEFESFELK